MMIQSVLFARPQPVIPLRVPRTKTVMNINQSSYQSDEGKQPRATIDGVPSSPPDELSSISPLPPSVCTIPPSPSTPHVAANLVDIILIYDMSCDIAACW